MCCVCDVKVTDRWYPLKHQFSSCAPKPILFPHTWPSARALLRGVLSTAMDTPQTPSGHRKQMGLWPPPGSKPDGNNGVLPAFELHGAHPPLPGSV